MDTTFFKSESYHRLSMDYVLDRLNVYSPFGKQAKKVMKVYTPHEREMLEYELDRVESMVSFIQKHKSSALKLQNIFKSVKDLSSTYERVLKDEILSVTELFEMKEIAKKMMDIKALQEEYGLDYTLEDVGKVMALLDPENTGIMTFHIYDMYSDELTKVRQEKRAVDEGRKSELVSIIKMLSDKYQIKIRPNGEVMINKREGALIDKIKASHEFNYLQESYVSVSFSIKPTELLDQYEKCKQRLELEEEVEEEQVRKMLTLAIKDHVSSLWNNCEKIGQLDLLMAKGFLGFGLKGVRPTITNDEFAIEDGRHLEVEASLRKKEKSYTPISMALNRGVTCITGANMGGKTVSMKLAGMLYSMVHLGMFVPAKSFKCPLGWYVITSIGDSQSVDEGLSTFGGEVVNVQEALLEADKEGLVLIDELARGTNPSEGFAISKAIINHLKNKKAFSLITTHFEGLTQDHMIKHLQVIGLKNVDMATIEEAVSNVSERGMDVIQSFMDYRLMVASKGIDIPKDAISIATLMGLSMDVIEDAKAIMKNLGGNDE